MNKLIRDTIWCRNPMHIVGYDLELEELRIKVLFLKFIRQHYLGNK